MTNPPDTATAAAQAAMRAHPPDRLSNGHCPGCDFVPDWADVWPSQLRHSAEAVAAAVLASIRRRIEAQQ